MTNIEIFVSIHFPQVYVKTLNFYALWMCMNPVISVLKKLMYKHASFPRFSVRATNQDQMTNVRFQNITNKPVDDVTVAMSVFYMQVIIVLMT